MKYSSTAIRGNYGALPELVRKTLANTFYTVSGMMGITAITGLLALSVHVGAGAGVLLLLASFALLFAIRKNRNNGYGLAFLTAFAAVQGVALGPVLGHYLRMPGGAGVVTTAAALTAIATFACAAYAQKGHDFSKWGAFLFGGLLVLIVAMVIGVFVSIPGLQVAIAAFGALLFLGFLLYDINDVVVGRETNYITASVGIYLNVLNLFQFILRLAGYSR